MTFQDASNKVADALKGAPMLLVLVLLNAGVLGMVTWLSVKSAEFRQSERTELVKLLQQCLAKSGG